MLKIFSRLISWTGFLLALQAASIVVISTFSHTNYLKGSELYSLLLFFGIACLFPRLAVVSIVFLLTLAPNFHGQISTFFGSGTSFNIPSYQIVTGFFFGMLAQSVRSGPSGIKDLPPPWPMGLVVIIITLSSGVGLARNLWLEGQPLYLAGLWSNLLNFGGGFHSLYRPISDLIALGLAGCFFIGLNYFLMNASNSDRDALIFRPLMAGLIISGLMATLQVMSEIGGASFRSYAALGFQPDIHAFAGFMLLGAVGLFGYYKTLAKPSERIIVLMTITISWIGLILSRSRASIIFALTAILLWLVWLGWKKSKILLFIVIFFLFTLFFGVLWLGYPKGWFAELIASAKHVDWSNFNQVDQLLSYRPGIYLAALSMFSQFPAFGIGQGTFYEMSADISFAGKSLLSELGGENAHNYFIQLLVETGFLGFFSCTLMIAYPFFVVKPINKIASGALGLGALFLGNIYSHSFLIRENVFIGTALLSLIYSFAPIKLSYSNLLQVGNKYKTLLFIAFILILFSIREVVNSFQHPSYVFGKRCYEERAVTIPDWTSGRYSLNIPRGARGLKIELYGPANVIAGPIVTQFKIFSGLETLLVEREVSISGHDVVQLLLPDFSIVSDDNTRMVLSTSRCDVPSAVKFSLDNRALGVKILRIDPL